MWYNTYKIGLIISNLDVISVIEDEENFGKLYDEDAVCLCLLLALEVIFMGRLLTFKVDDTLFRAPPIRQLHSLFETYLSKLEKSCKRGNTGLRVTTSVCMTDNSFNDEFSSMSFELCDSLISLFIDLIHQQDSDEDIDKDYLREEELRLCLEEEERLHCEHEKLIVEEKMFRLEVAKKLRLEEEKMLQLAEEKNIKRK
ncbi:hypothetical protein Tco_0779398 [Tanacetum coccineum]